MLSVAFPFDMHDCAPRARFARFTPRRCNAHSAKAPVLKEHDDKYVVWFDTAKNVAPKISVLNNILTIETTASWTYRIELPRDADANAATAEMPSSPCFDVAGLLAVTLPKKELDDEHPGIECDKSGMKPIVGKRYNLRGHNFDLCKAEYDKLCDREKALYTMILPPPKQVKLDVPVESAGVDESDNDKDDDDTVYASKLYSININAAGVRASDLKVKVDDSLLLVHGATQATGARLEEQVFRLPRDSDVQNIRAVSVDGLLTVTVPKIVATTIDITMTDGETDEDESKKEEETVTVEKPTATAAAEYGVDGVDGAEKMEEEEGEEEAVMV